MQKIDIAVIGAGAAGFFGAIRAAELGASVSLFEQTNRCLSKVKISGGGRCNVTHACFDPLLLAKNYPRGERELRSLFHLFGPQQTIEWFAKEGVLLKTEEDGRMFPVTDNSQTIIDALTLRAAKEGVNLFMRHRLEKIDVEEKGFHLLFANGLSIQAKKLFLALGSSPNGFKIAQSLGHTIVEPVPSLFTFNLPDSLLIELAGVSLPSVGLKLKKCRMSGQGPLLITHWGLSGPAVLKLSAFAARDLHSIDYQETCVIDWLPQLSWHELRECILERRKEAGAKKIISDYQLFALPKQLLKQLFERAGVVEATWNSLSNRQIESLLALFKNDEQQIKGTTCYKKEFVTCGGVKRSEVDFRTMQSRIQPNLYFAGELLDVDGITGGFNFQAAWSGGWVAGQAMALTS